MVAGRRRHLIGWLVLLAQGVDGRVAQGVRSVCGLIPTGCTTWTDGCNTCYSGGDGVLTGCTTDVCTDGNKKTPYCSDFSDGRICSPGVDCSHPEDMPLSCCDLREQARAATAPAPQCDDNCRFNPMQISTDDAWCATNSGDEVPGTREPISGLDTVAKLNRCLTLGLAQEGEPCKPPQADCGCSISGDGTCPRCATGLQCRIVHGQTFGVCAALPSCCEKFMDIMQKIANHEAGTHLKPQCSETCLSSNTDALYKARQFNPSTGDRHCVTVDTGELIPGTEDGPVHAGYTEQECSFLGLAAEGEPCLSLAQRTCPSDSSIGSAQGGTGDGTCPRCGVGLRCRDDSAHNNNWGICEVDTVTPAGEHNPALVPSYPSYTDDELRQQLDAFNQGFNNGFQQFENDLFSTCNVHALQVMCDDEIGAGNEANLEIFCGSHCNSWSKMVLSHCKPGELPSDMQDAIESRMAACDSGATSV